MSALMDEALAVALEAHLIASAEAYDAGVVLTSRIGITAALDALSDAGFLATDEERRACSDSHSVTTPCSPTVRRVTPWRSA